MIMTPEDNDLKIDTGHQGTQPLSPYTPLHQYPEAPASFLRCPIPPIGLGPVDNLRQFYNKGVVPQFRAQVLNTLTPTGAILGGSTATTTTSSQAVNAGQSSSVTANTSSSSSASSSSKSSSSSSVSVSPPVLTPPNSNLGRVQVASVTTPVLNQNQSYTTTLIMAKTFGVVSISTTAAVRVRLYTTAAARNADLGRSISTPVALGNPVGIIGDWYLTTQSEFLWFCSPMAVGFNADEPTSTNVYASFVNPVSSSNKIQVSVTFVVMEI